MAESGIGEILGQTLQILGFLEQALRMESDALLSDRSDPEAITAIAQDKQQRTLEINDLVRSCDRQLVEQGYAAGREGMESWLKTLPSSDPNHGVWQSILAISARCKELNEANGVKIGLLSRRTQEALSILFGGHGGNETYGPDGTGRAAAHIHTSYKV